MVVKFHIPLVIWLGIGNCDFGGSAILANTEGSFFCWERGQAIRDGLQFGHTRHAEATLEFSAIFVLNRFLISVKN